MLEEQGNNSGHNSEPLLVDNNSAPTLLLRIWHSFDTERLQNVDRKGTDLMPLPNVQPYSLTYEGKDTKLPILAVPIIDYKEKLLAISVEMPVLFIHSSNDILTDKQQQMYEDLHEEAKKRDKLFVLDINDLSEDAGEAILNLMEDYKEKIKEKHALIDIERRIILEDLPTLLGALRNKYKDVPENRGILYTEL